MNPLLRGLILRHSGRWLLAAGLWSAVLSGRLILGLLLQAVLDTLTGRAHSYLGVPTLIALVLGVELARVGVQFPGIIGHVEPQLEYRSSRLLRMNVLRAIFSRPGARAFGLSQGEAISRLGTDIDELGNFMIWSPTNVGRVLLGGVALVIMLRVDTAVTLGVAVPLAAVIALSRLANARVAAYRRTSRQAAGQVSGALGEIIGAVQAIKVAGAEDRVTGHIRRLGLARRRAAVAEQLFTSLHYAVNSGVVSVGTGLVLLLAASSMRAGRFTVGDLALFLSYLQMLADIMAMLGLLLVRMRRAEVSMERLAELVGEPRKALLERPAPQPTPVPSGTSDRLEVVDVRGLTCRHAPGGPGIAGVNFTLRRGSVTVVTGRVGSGKTTLLRSLLGLLPLETGSVRWNGVVVADPASFMVPPRCAYVPQAPRLFSASILENILMGLELSGDEVATAIQRAMMEPDLASMMAGVNTVIGPRGVRLSGGQVHRVAAARAFVRRPDLLVVDDLSSALDVDTEGLLWDRVLSDPGLTVLAVSHRPPALRRADLVLVLTHGQVQAQGTLTELLRCSSEMQELWRIQGNRLG